MAVVYRTGSLNWHLAKALVKIRTIGLVNIAAGGRRIPELLQDQFTPERVAEVAKRLLFDPEEAVEQPRRGARLRGWGAGPTGCAGAGGSYGGVGGVARAFSAQAGH